MQIPTTSSRRSFLGCSQEISSLANNPRNPHNILKRHSILLLSPSQLNWKTFVLYNPTLANPPARQGYAHNGLSKLTKEEINQVLLDRSRFEITKNDDRRTDLAETELLSIRGKGVLGVLGLGGELAGELAVGEHVGVEDGAGPPDSRLVEGCLVEGVVVAEEGVYAAGGWELVL